MKMRSGMEFSPYFLENISTAKVEPAPPIPMLVNVASLLRTATQLENERFECGADDANGFELSSHPSSPHTDPEGPERSDEEFEDTRGSCSAAQLKNAAASNVSP